MKKRFTEEKMASDRKHQQECEKIVKQLIAMPR